MYSIQERKTMKILVTNDDGIEDEGLRKLIEGNSKEHELYVVAPDKRYTGYSGAVSFDRLIEVEEYPLYIGERKAYKVWGTPADCVILALDELTGPVDIVISGINDEANTGDDIRLSATLGACREASYSDISAMALSLAYGSGEMHYQPAIRFILHLLKNWEQLQLPKDVYLNINFPNISYSDIKGVLFTHSGRCRYKDRVHLVPGKSRLTYQIYGTKIEEEQIGTDEWAINHNYISITPLNRDQTDKKILSQLNKINKKEFPFYPF
jgi:5'-nucleotidase